MRFQNILAASAALLSLGSARLVGVAIPETIAPGSTFDTVLITENYIQTVYDVAVAVGITPGEGYPNTLGQVLTSKYLGPDESNSLTNITFQTTVPATTQKGQYRFTAVLYSLYGASSGATFSNFNLTATISDSTSTNYISSLQQ